MTDDPKKLLEAQFVVEKIASGINPIDDTPIKEHSFLTGFRKKSPSSRNGTGVTQ